MKYDENLLLHARKQRKNDVNLSCNDVQWNPQVPAQMATGSTSGTVLHASRYIWVLEWNSIWHAIGEIDNSYFMDSLTSKCVIKGVAASST